MFHNFTADTGERDWSVVCCIVFFTFFVCWCTTPGIRKLLDNINPHKASGPDNISGRILKDLQNFTAPILTIIFQKSLL
jgi:hypothetical protein